MIDISDLNISSRLLSLEAKKRGYDLTFFEGSKNLVLLKKGNTSFYISGSRSSFQSSIGSSIAKSKFLTKQVLVEHKFPTANFIFVKEEKDLEKLKYLSFPLVMKPNHGNQGEGVIIGIESYEEAEINFFKHRELRPEDEGVVFEELLSGEEYRILCVDYKFVAATRRKPAFVIGDGKNNVRDLIDLKNNHPWRGIDHQSPLTKIEIDELVLSNLSEQNFSLDDIPDMGVEIFLRKTSNLSMGGEPSNVTDQVCQANKDLFEKIARACDLNVAGIDFMCSDLSKRAEEQKGAGIIEVNASPGLRMHHYPLLGEPIDAAAIVFDMIEKKLAQR
jgi:cyanophycin synthetase